MAKISPLASVDPRASLADDVEVGPFCLVGPDVKMGPGNRLIAHVVVHGHTTLGANNVIHPNVVLGGPPQDKKWRGEPTQLIVGSNNIFREAVTINAGTVQGGGVTRVGDNNLLMVNTHIGHDCQLGNNCVIANNVMLAGHVVVGNNVVMSGAAGAHHFVTIGDYTFVAGQARLHHDVPPFVKVSDDDRIRAINAVGMKRAGFTDADVEAVEEVVRRLFLSREKPFATAMAEFDTANGLHPCAKQMIEFLRRRDAGKNGRYLEAFRTKH